MSEISNRSNEHIQDKIATDTTSKQMFSTTKIQAILMVSNEQINSGNFN